MAVLTSKESDLPRWYQDVLSTAELAETGPSLEAEDLVAIAARAY
jgi:hypothetical protein